MDDVVYLTKARHYVVDKSEEARQKHAENNQTWCVAVGQVILKQPATGATHVYSTAAGHNYRIPAEPTDVLLLPTLMLPTPSTLT